MEGIFKKLYQWVGEKYLDNLGDDFTPPPVPPDEEVRLQELKSLKILNTEPEERFDRITSMTAQVFDVPICLVNLISKDRAFAKSCYGVPVRDTPKKISFCAYTILGDGLLEIPDTRQHPTFANSPLVKGYSNIQFYAGQPITGPTGKRVGSLCLMDHRPRELTEKQKEILKKIAVWVELELNAAELSRVIEARKLKEQKLLEEEARFKALVSNIPDVFYRCLPGSWHIAYINDAIQDLAGYGASQLMQDSDLKILVHSDDFQGFEAQVSKALQEKKDWEVDHRLVTLSGEERWVKSRGRGFYHDEKLIYLDGALIDITKEKEIDNAKSEFVSLASHQLRTPLTSIKWILQTANKREHELSDWQKEFLQDALSSTEKMIKLVDSLLNVSRLEAGVLSVDPVKTELNEFLESLTKEAAATALKNNQHIIFNQLPEKVYAVFDPQLITQVIGNLISNALRYSNTGDSIDIGLEEKGDQIEISVSDQGIGISSEDQKKLFTKFFRTADAAKKTAEGSGLGLYIINKVLAVCEGRISVESEVGQGTTFTVQIPLKCSAKKGTRKLV